ncbi:hypothetical protein GPJ56_006804 [Histomonas meleagridis]|uniref:uncharacterized protein n=1 Tax=Histomonas meleagridis TaxID=135588 RepID=UPI00355A5D52|nr:hypothetical protein GPJ56_006804 [Histomonas meleagridis]KAH0800213.1 hypothetical protein GO595_007325 [Histomonas meleagridis]
MSQKQKHEIECQFCFSKSVSRQEDGTYICMNCHAIQDIQDTFDEYDNLAGNEKTSMSFRISQSSQIEDRSNYVVLYESMQLILACQTVSAEKILHVSLSDTVFHYLQQFYYLIKPPIKEISFKFTLLILLSAINHIGLPVTCLDLIRWIRDGLLPYNYPLEFLPSSFTDRLSPAESKLLHAPIINTNNLIIDEGYPISVSMHPLPNCRLTLWRIASILGVPARSFVEFCISLAQDPNLITSSLKKTLDPNRILYTSTKLNSYGFSIPISLSIFAMTIIYRLDGTDWIHPTFQKLGFPMFKDVLKRLSETIDVHPAFPNLNVRLPHMNNDISTLLSDNEPLNIEVKCIINDVSRGFGKEVKLPTNEKLMANVNNDVRALICALGRAFGITEQAIMRQYWHLLKRRFGMKYKSYSGGGEEEVTESEENEYFRIADFKKLFDL